MRWFTSDMHYFHAKIIEYCQRPFFSVETMNTMMVANWNYAINDDDTVYVIGDVSFGTTEETQAILAQLVGRKVLVLGNHDKGRTKLQWMRLGFEQVVDFMDIQLGRFTPTLCHYPDNPATGHFLRLPSSNHQPLLCGHVHDRWKVRGKTINVGVDVWDFTPVSEEVILTLLEAMHVK